MEDPRIQYQPSIDQASAFFFSVILALTSFLFTIYLNFKSIPDLDCYLLIIGSLVLMGIASAWYKKIELMALYSDVRIEHLKKVDKKALEFYKFEKEYIEANRKKRKYKSFLSIEYYDTHYPQLLAKFFLATFVAGILLWIIRPYLS